jgi:streptomycin 6-kinase
LHEADIRKRLVGRYGTDVEPWLDQLPSLLHTLADRWQLQLGHVIPLGNMSVVVHCGDAVLKVSPDLARLVDEVRALGEWSDTTHVPSVLAADESVGALLLEAIEPGTPLLSTGAYPSLADVAQLFGSLHVRARGEYPTLSDRVEYLFAASGVVEGRALARELVESAQCDTLIHGDLTPRNVLLGGQRGLVAIDPAACVGEPEFDAVDLVMWQASGRDEMATRADALALDVERTLAWCDAFTPMVDAERASPR